MSPADQDGGGQREGEDEARVEELRRVDGQQQQAAEGDDVGQLRVHEPHPAGEEQQGHEHRALGGDVEPETVRNSSSRAEVRAYLALSGTRSPRRASRRDQGQHADVGARDGQHVEHAAADQRLAIIVLQPAAVAENGGLQEDAGRLQASASQVALLDRGADALAPGVDAAPEQVRPARSPAPAAPTCRRPIRWILLYRR